MKKFLLTLFSLIFFLNTTVFAEKWHINMKKKEKKEFTYKDGSTKNLKLN